MKSIWIGIGCSHHSVPSLSNTATRSSTGTGAEPSSPVVAATKSKIACFAAPSRQLGSDPLPDVLAVMAPTLGRDDGRAHHPKRTKRRRVGSGSTLTRVRIATWNVNSLKQRLPRLLPWLDERRPDVVCLQETKLADDAFRELVGDELSSRGYEVAAHGEATWNGVAIFSRVGLEDVVAGIEGAPGFPHPEARAVSATCGGIRVVCVYVPNGRTPGSAHYEYKLAWLEARREMVAARPGPTIVCGDMNIAPADADVFDPAAYIGQTHVTAPEREALASLEAL